MHDINRNRFQQGAYHSLVKEIQLDEEKFEQYFRLTRKYKIPPNCSGNTCPWRHILDSPYPLTYKSLHGAIQFVVSASIGGRRTNRMPHPDIWKRSHLFTYCSVLPYPHTAYMESYLKSLCQFQPIQKNSQTINQV